MHAILSYRGNRPTNKATNPHTDRTDYTAPQLARSVIKVLEDAMTVSIDDM